MPTEDTRVKMKSPISTTAREADLAIESLSHANIRSSNLAHSINQPAQPATTQISLNSCHHPATPSMRPAPLRFSTQLAEATRTGADIGEMQKKFALHKYSICVRSPGEFFASIEID